MSFRCACDTGGTFTDLLVEDEKNRIRLYKASTTPADPPEGILNALSLAAEDAGLSLPSFLNDVETLIHGTTHAINAIITGNTARTAFLTTMGHRDILVLREGGRQEPFNFSVPFPSPYVPRALTFEIDERIKADGAVQKPLNEESVVNVLQNLKSEKVESIAVCLLWSTVNSVHEKRVGELLKQYLPGIPFSLSSQLNPILREYRRASSTAIDASLKPLMTRYLGGLSERLSTAGFKGRLLMLTSKGGVMDFRDLANAPIHSIGSGPSLAPLAGRYFARIDARYENAIVADTGGTTYDVSLVRDGAIPHTPETWIGERYRGHMVGFPSVDVKSIGAGGGSIAWVDRGGLLHVGPQSSGAVPGPACYGRGGEAPTVTDASLVLGHIDPEYFLGGSMQLNADLAVRAIERDICKPLGLDLLGAADAIIRLATENMVTAIEQITIHQGVDPRNTVLIGGGGAAGLNSVSIAKRLRCEKVIFPEVGAALSASGGLISELHADYRAICHTSTDDFARSKVNSVLRGLASDCRRFFRGPGKDSHFQEIEFFVEARYRSQIWEIDVELERSGFSKTADLESVRHRFDDAHEQVFGFRDEKSEVEFVGWRAVARCRVGNDKLGRVAKQKNVNLGNRRKRKMSFDGRQPKSVPIFRFAELKKNNAITGPAIVESPHTTIVIDPGAKAIVTTAGSLVVTP